MICHLSAAGTIENLKLYLAILSEESPDTLNSIVKTIEEKATVLDVPINIDAIAEMPPPQRADKIGMKIEEMKTHMT